MPPVLDCEVDCNDVCHTTNGGNNIVVIQRMSGRTTTRRLCGFKMRARFQHSGCHSLCWTVFSIVVVTLVMCPGSSFGMPVPGRHEGHKTRGVQKRSIIGDNVVSTIFILVLNIMTYYSRLNVRV